MSDEHTKYTDGSLIAVPVFFFFSPSSRITTEMTVIDNEQCWNIHAPKTPTIIIINNRKTFLLSTRLGFRFGQCSRHVRGRTIPFVSPPFLLTSCHILMPHASCYGWTCKLNETILACRARPENENRIQKHRERRKRRSSRAQWKVRLYSIKDIN